MYDGNPHAPTTAWLESIAGPGSYVEAVDGDTGTHTFDRDGDKYEVTVVKNPGEGE